APPGHAAAHHRENAAQSVAALQNAFRAICVVETLQFGGNQVERLVPRNALPLVPAAQFFLAAARLPVLALHRVLETVSAEALMLLRAAARAGADLRVLDRVFVRVVGLDLLDHAVDHVRLDHAALPA